MSSYTREQLVEQAALTEEDIQKVMECRGSHNRLGFAYQIGFVRLQNRLPSQQPFEIVDELLTYTAVQLEMDAANIEQYSARRETVAQHQNRIRKHLELRSFGKRETSRVEDFLFEECCRLEQTTALRSRVRVFLRENRILEPSETSLDRLIGEQRRKSREYIFQTIHESLSASAIDTLNALLVARKPKKSDLQQLKEPCGMPSPAAVERLADKLDRISDTGILKVDVAWLNNNYQRSLSKYARKCSSHKLREIEPSHRYAALVCFLSQTYRDSIDQLVDMLDKLVNKVSNSAQGQLEEAMRRRHKWIRQSISMVETIAAIALDDEVDDSKVRERIFDEFTRDELTQQIHDAREWLAGKNSHVFHGIVDRFGYIRKFFPRILKHLSFEGQKQKKKPEVIKAIEVLRDMNEQGQRVLPDDAPMDFVPAKYKSFVANNGVADKQAWECALMLTLRDEIKSGNVAVDGSKRFGQLDSFFTSDDRWKSQRDSFFKRAGFPSDAKEIGSYLTERLDGAFNDFLEAQPDNEYARVDEDGWHLSTDAAEKLDDVSSKKLDHLKSWLGKNMRTIRLPELLIEVDNELQLTRHFLAPARQQERRVQDVCETLVTMLAHGCNIGTYTMSRLTAGVSYKQIKRISDWQLTEESQRLALADVVGAMCRLGTTQAWGDGTTSSSDGRRYMYPRKVLQQTFSHKLHDFALEFYSFVADNYAPFYAIPIECTHRDAPYVLDGLIYNESDLDIKEHYTDTHGYTDINFAAFAMLGKRFCPRIRGMQKQRIYRIDNERDYGVLEPLVRRKDRKINLRIIAEQWDRIAHFYASLESGHATASIALRRLAAFSQKNRFYRANRELGRVFKTEFILQYMSRPPMRRRVRRGLLKGEQFHSLAKDVFYAKRGRISARDLQGQMTSCSCLTLILACIIYWQAKEIERVVTECHPQECGIDLAMLEHISPIEWENVLLYGEYVINRRLIQAA